MARRAVISPGVLKGYLLEEAVASLIRNAGYRLLTSPEDDPHDLSLMSNGLQVRGRGGFHQADVLGELTWAPAFGNPIRLFIEAKWRGHGQGRVGIPEARHAVGILQDVNQVLVTVQPRPAGIAPALTNEDITNSGRGTATAIAMPCVQHRASHRERKPMPWHIRSRCLICHIGNTMSCDRRSTQSAMLCTIILKGRSAPAWRRHRHGAGLSDGYARR
ncbi:hypothetical protein Bra1253DRAFT_06080 [Bradyrhizobium sp. WSM1253]|nr:hypothetical protein Bra1253DRAFT_06080 [Bradyrhizobium sp. WSM1253]